MSSPQVLRILEKSGPGYLLVLIEPAGKKTLDLNLTGTNRTDKLFKLVIKDASTEEYQTSKFTGSLKEWKALLAFVLLHERPEGHLPDHLKGVEIVAEIARSTFTITIRRIVGGITQILGRVELQELEIDPDEAPDIFLWVDAAAASSDELRTQLATFQTSSTEQQNEIAKLTAELDQLVKEKRKHEEELLSKFAALLNEKKLKIRDQQRLLSHSKVDHDVAEEVRSERSKDPVSRKAGSSRSKRKARDEVEEEAMSEGEEQTPPASDAETDAGTADESGDEDDGRFAPAPAASQASTRRSAAAQSQSQPQQMDIDDTSLPPRRALPFSKAKVGGPTPPASSSNQQKAVEEDDEETEDDEL